MWRFLADYIQLNIVNEKQLIIESRALSFSCCVLSLIIGINIVVCEYYWFNLRTNA